MIVKTTFVSEVIIINYEMFVPKPPLVPCVLFNAIHPNPKSERHPNAIRKQHQQKRGSARSSTMPNYPS
jgi:hypothetical protein